jgi:hypothetical protein
MLATKAYICNRCKNTFVNTPNPFDLNIKNVDPELRALIYERNLSLIPENVMDRNVIFYCKDCSKISSHNIDEKNYVSKYKFLESSYNNLQKEYEKLEDNNKFLNRKNNQYLRQIQSLNEQLDEIKNKSFFKRLFK